MKSQSSREEVERYSKLFAALGMEPRLRIVRLLLSRHPEGMVAGRIQSALGIAGSTLSHHLQKLRHDGLVWVSRDHRFLWYRANTEALRDLLAFLYAECCLRPEAISPGEACCPFLTRRML